MSEAVKQVTRHMLFKARHGQKMPKPSGGMGLALDARQRQILMRAVYSPDDAMAWLRRRSRGREGNVLKRMCERQLIAIDGERIIVLQHGLIALNRNAVHRIEWRKRNLPAG